MTREPLLPESGRNDADPALATLQRHACWTLPLTLAVATLAMFGKGLGWMRWRLEAGLNLRFRLTSKPL